MPKLATYKGWFLTYPQNETSKEELMDKLKLLNIEEAIVCHELHELEGHHLHAFVKLNDAIKLRDAPVTFNLLDKTGNYQPAKSWTAVKSYVQKDGDFISYNIDVPSAQNKKAKRNRELIDRPIHELVDSGEISILVAPQLKKARICYEESKNDVFEVKSDEKRGIWIYGPPGVGKSYKVRQEHPDLYNKSQNKWWDGYTGQKSVLIDDFDRQGECLSHYLKIWADVYKSSGEVKGGTVNLNYNKLIITSNYSIDEIFFADPILIAALKRRFEIIHMPLKTF